MRYIEQLSDYSLVKLMDLKRLLKKEGFSIKIICLEKESTYRNTYNKKQKESEQ